MAIGRDDRELLLFSRFAVGLLPGMQYYIAQMVSPLLTVVMVWLVLLVDLGDDGAIWSPRSVLLSNSIGRNVLASG